MHSTLSRFAIARLGALLLSTLLFSLSAHADYVWLERDGATAHAYLGELQPDRPVASAELLGDARAFMADGKSLATTMSDSHYSIANLREGGDLRFTAKRQSSNGGLLFYQAKAGREDTKPVNDLELVPDQAGGNTFRLYWKSRQVPADQVNVYTSEGWTRSFKAAADGSVTITTPFPGRYVLEVTAKVNGTVELDGKKYDDVRHVATVSFVVAK
ncbi:hypothetical protein [Methylovorus sp. MP688]|uniref:hypothetical protein n=1 Tax=Methylovorus sp. (strain MP688) TaxID=887061 RepID=UPI0001EC43F2|nr:hypothetical protein [Methylovorus sp. MP688]ADQ83627.1 conserved hypothetical protein [Methylovorus sp. MP688]